jgi:hypothetical protein
MRDQSVLCRKSIGAPAEETAGRAATAGQPSLYSGPIDISYRRVGLAGERSSRPIEPGMPAATSQSRPAKLLLSRLLRYQVIHGRPTTWQRKRYGCARMRKRATRLE